MNRYSMEAGRLVLTRKVNGESDSGILFGFKPERDISEILEIGDVAVELALQILEVRGEQLRVVFQTPHGFGILRENILVEDDLTVFNKLVAKRTPHLEYPQVALVYSVWVHKPAIVKMLQDPKLLEFLKQTGFLPMFRLKFWNVVPTHSRTKDPILALSLVGVKGHVMFKKATLLELPQMGSHAQ